VNPLNSLTLNQLRRRARNCDQPLKVRFYRNWNRCVGNDGYIVTDVALNCVAAGPLDEDELRSFLVRYLT